MILDYESLAKSTNNNICLEKGRKMTDQEFENRKQMIFEIVSHKDYKPMKLREMSMFLSVPKEERDDFRKVITALEKDGKIVITNKGKITLTDASTVSGIFMGTMRGFGFVRVEGFDDDIFIPERDCKDAFDGDTVLVELWKESHGMRRGKNGSARRREGKILRILERKNDHLVGTFSKSRNYGFVIVDNEKFSKDIFIPKKKTMGAVDGHKVYVHVTDFGDHDKNTEGEIVEILGHVNDPGVDILSVIRSYGLSEGFPDDVALQLKSIPYEVEAKEAGGRVDLRELQTVTIDGADAKDLDDAITLSKDEKGNYHLGVHIADVSQYVTEGSALDKEAIKRGTSVYLVDRVIPMLPHQLSNGICSLNAGVDRLALSCMMEFDAKGKLVSHRIAETVIQVDERMNYSDVKDILVNQDAALCERYKDFVSMFKCMEELAEILRKIRKKKGSIDFDFPECNIELDKNGTPIEIHPYERNVATRIIEEFMLAANQVVAEDYFWMEIPFVYRTHENPDPEKMKELAALTKSFGHKMKVSQDVIHPREIQKMIDSLLGTEEEAFLSRLTLRSMKRAKYTTENTGHFGLATKYYCHFTSPIRRYPDLQIHRIIKENLHGGIKEKRIVHYMSILEGIARQSSDRERAADDAEREVEKMKKAEYMQSHLGECFDGVINGVTSWGIYVELPNTVEGMVRIADMSDDVYNLDEQNYQVVGKYSGKTYQLGDKVKVEAVKVDTLSHTIDFEFVDEEEL